MKVPILTYHSLDESGSPVSVSPSRFRHHLDALGAAGWTGVPLREALAPAGSASSRAVALTFDDGYANVLRHALPALASRGWRATIFPITRYVGGDNRWPGQSPLIPVADLLDWNELGELVAAGWEIGAHTETHPDLTVARNLEDELFGATARLEERLGESVTSFAYPYGRHDARVRAAVRGRFARACTTSMGIARAADDRQTLRRLDMRYFTTDAACRLLASPLLEAYATFCHAWRQSRAFPRVAGRYFSPRVA